MIRRRRRGCASGLLLALLATTSAFAEGTRAGDPTGGRVVLLHGLGRSPLDLALLANRLEARGYTVCNLGYDTRAASIELAAEEVVEGMRGCAMVDRPTHFVTHSMGALVLRVLSRDGRIPPGGRAVLLAPPNAGSELADRLRTSRLLARGLGPLGVQLGTGPSDLPNRLPPPSIPFGVIAGNRWLNPLGPIWLDGAHDGTVRVEATRLPGMSDHLVVPHTHSFIAWGAPVAEQVDVFLRTGRFDRP